MTTALRDAAQPLRGLPEDLRQVVGERRLIELSLEAAQIVGEGLPRPVRIVQDEPGPRTLLTLLTYCYAAGIYGSEDIQWACEHDGSVHYICAKTWPDETLLRCFRRANRPWIEACLAWVCKQAFPGEQIGSILVAFARRKVELAILTDTVVGD